MTDIWITPELMANVMAQPMEDIGNGQKGWKICSVPKGAQVHFVTVTAAPDCKLTISIPTADDGTGEKDGNQTKTEPT